MQTDGAYAKKQKEMQIPESELKAKTHDMFMSAAMGKAMEGNVMNAEKTRDIAALNLHITQPMHEDEMKNAMEFEKDRVANLETTYVAMRYNLDLHEKLLKQMQDRKVANYSVGKKYVEFVDLVTKADCIRNRYKSMQTNRKPMHMNSRHAMKTLRNQCIYVGNQWTVSYTHLTLPTILRV